MRPHNKDRARPDRSDGFKFAERYLSDAEAIQSTIALPREFGVPVRVYSDDGQVGTDADIQRLVPDCATFGVDGRNTHVEWDDICNNVNDRQVGVYVPTRGDFLLWGNSVHNSIRDSCFRSEASGVARPFLYTARSKPDVMRQRAWRRLVALDPEVMDAYHEVQLDMAIRDWAWL